MTTSSPAAMRDYLRGEQFYRRSEWDSAAAAYRDAVSDDSTFALAHYRLATTYGWIGNATAAEAQAAGEAAVRWASRLPANDQTIVRAYRMFQMGDVAATDTMLRYTAAHPDDVDGWYLLGESQFHRRSMRPMTPEALRAPFERVIALDSSLTPAVIHPLDLALSQNDRATFERFLPVLQRSGAADQVQRFRSMEAIVWTDTPVDTPVARLIREGQVAPAIISFSTLMRNPGRDADARLARARAVVEAFPEDVRQRSQVDMLLGAALAGMGRVEDALEVARTMTWLPDAVPAISVVPVVAGFAPPGYADSLRRSLDSQLARAREAGAPPGLFVSYWRSMFLLGAGDLDAAAEMLNRARVLKREDFPQQGFVFDLLDAARGALQVERGDTVAGLAALRAGLEASGMAEGNFMSAPLRLREAILLASRPATREEGILMLHYGFDYDPQYAAMVQLALGEAYEAKGDNANAAAAYTEFLELWKKADQPYQARVNQVREALVRVQRAAG